MADHGGGVVGIVANPASGKDIRRLVAHASTFDNNEKISIVRRVLVGLEAVGVGRVWSMPDTHAIVSRAAGPARLSLDVQELPMPVLGRPSDSFEAARRLADLGADAIVTLGGDGTNRVVAKGCGDVPLVAISTGTNNVFPRMVEGTLAGLAAGLVAVGAVPRDRAVRRLPCLDVSVDGEARDLALIDVVSSHHAWVGARALWEPAHLRELVLSRIAPAEIGMCGLGGLLHPDAAGSANGVHLVIGVGGRRLLAPVGPGLIRTVPIASSRLIGPGAVVTLAPGRGTIALDGEREFELLRDDHHVEVRLNPLGPNVVDIDAALHAGAQTGVFELATAP